MCDFRFNYDAVVPQNPINPTTYGFTGIVPQTLADASVPIISVTGLLHPQVHCQRSSTGKSAQPDGRVRLHQRCRPPHYILPEWAAATQAATSSMAPASTTMGHGPDEECSRVPSPPAFNPSVAVLGIACNVDLRDAFRWDAVRWSAYPLATCWVR